METLIQPIETVEQTVEQTVANSMNPPSKYAQKKLAAVEHVKNALKIQENKAVSTEERKKHKKVSRNLLLALRNEQMTVVCDDTGIVSILQIPKIEGKVLTWGSPLAYLPNARGIAQEGYDYLNRLDTQILAGIFITLATEYELIRTMVDQSGAATNAILRTASKEKLIQAVILVETFIHSRNHSYQPKLSLIYDAELKDNGVEPRLTEWMRLVEDAIQRPDETEYDENAVGFKPMKSIRDLKKEYSQSKKEEKKVSSLKDPLFRERAQFKKDMKEAKILIKNLKEVASQKLCSFLSQLFTEESFLTVDKALLDQVIGKLEPITTDSAVRLIQILMVDRDSLRKDISIDDLDDPLMQVVESQDQAASECELDNGGSDQDSNQDAEQNEEEEDSIEPPQDALEPFAGEFEIDYSTTALPTQTAPVMPEGLSFVEKILWKKKHEGK